MLQYMVAPRPRGTVSACSTESAGGYSEQVMSLCHSSLRAPGRPGRVLDHQDLGKPIDAAARPQEVGFNGAEAGGERDLLARR